MQRQLISNFESLSQEGLEKYSGKWITIIGNDIVASGESFKEVHNFTKENFPGKTPLIGKIPQQIPTVFSAG